MKKILYLIIYMTLALPFWGWGQKMEPKGEGEKGGLEYTDKYIEKGNVYGAPNPPGVNHSIYTARDSIRLKNGFWSSDVSSKPFIARIDESLVFPVEYQDPVDPNRPLDYGKPVGAIAGTVDVSPTGAATYQIPIFTPPGTAGMEPKISIVYNSQGGNGLLGVGWDIAGLSAITRTGQTIYHDGKTTPISWNSSEDRLLLDGNRLISTNGTTYGSANSTYATEIETFSKITALNTGSNRWFKVETKDGMTLEYGSTVDARLFLGLNNEALSWKLNKVSDANDNFMTYTYKKVYYGLWGESVIEKIEYTGNPAAGQNPYATITFLYAEREDIQEVYVAGSKMQSTYLLRGIKVESEGQVVRRYWFNYAKMGFYSHLIEIIEEGSDGKSPNSTIIEYPPMSTGHEHNEHIVGYVYEYKTVFADINGDGRDDFITITGQGNLWQWHLYLANDTGYEHHFSKTEDELTNNNGVPGISVFVSKPDISGKPHIFVERHYKLSNGECGLDPNSNFSCHKYIYSEYTFNDNISALNQIGQNFETIYQMHKNNSLEYCWPKFQTGDIYGDGGVYYIQANTLSNKTLAWKNTNINMQSFNWGTVYEFYFIDFDGDGTDELVTLTSNDIKIYKFKNGVSVPELTHTLSYNYSPPMETPGVRFGDFNGDGKMDILANDYSNKKYLYIYFSTGTGFTEPYQIYSNNNFNINYIYTGDMNGDGKDDIIHVNYETIDVYYSRGDGTFEKGTFSIDTNTNMATLPSFVSNYRGTDKFSFLIKAGNDDGQPTTHEIYFKGKELNSRAVSIIDGLNNKTKFEYLPLSKGGDFYTREIGIASGDGVVNFQGALYAVSKMTQPNGLGGTSGTSTISFSYKGAKVHRKGKGFLGFSEVTVTNAATGIKTINNYEYNPTYYNVALKETKTQLTSGSNIRTITHTNKTHHFGSKRIMPYITESKTNDHLTGFTVTETFPESEYDFANGNLKKKKTVYGSNVFTETTDYVYGSYGNWGPKNKVTEEKITTTHADDPNASYVRKVNYLYNGKGNLITETTDNGIVTNYSNFNAFGLPETITVTAPNALSYSKSLQYDDRKRFVIGITDPLGATSQKYSATGDLQYDIDITGQKTSYKYDGFGRLTGTKTPEGHIITTNYGWENINEIKSISYVETTAPGRPKTRTYYDVLGREVRSKTEGYDGKMICTDQKYNAKGELWQTSLPYFDNGTPQWTENRYDQYGRIDTVMVTLTTTLYTKYEYSANKTTITEPDGKRVTKTYNAHGDLVEIAEHDAGKYTITYKYHCSGQPKKVLMDEDKVTVTMEYDAYGMQTKLKDPNAGDVSYTYNAFGDMLTQTDARGKVTTNIYDNLRRIKTQTMTGEPPKTYDYYTSGQGKGKLESIASSQSLQSYEYGDFGRLTKTTEKLNDGQTFETQYAYDDYGNKTEITYPGGFKIKRIYNNKGYVTEIRQASNNQLIWKRLTENALGQPLTYQMGNNKTTTCQYNGYNLPTRVSIPNIQDFAYNIDSTNNNMRWRQDRTTANVKTENFDYDLLHRLTVVKQNQSTVLTTVYDNNGNILSKTDVGAGTYQYEHLTKVHALTSITGSIEEALANSGDQTISSYTAFHKADTIKNLKTNQRLIITYGVNNQRTRIRLYDENILQKTKYYATNYEKEITSKTTREINYISTPYGTLAAYIKEDSGAGQLYYLYKDHLGSITAITNAAGAVLERRSFDAWGRQRNPDNWTYNGILPMTILDRGYTGHEHLPEFGLINMNGRLYDPLIGLMLSPDPYVSMPESMQGFNRYNYCLNNPLKYTDPDGEFIQFIIGAVVGAINGAIIGNQAGLKGGKLILATLAGAAIGAGTAGIGTAMSASTGFAVSGAAAGAAQAGSFALLSGVANGVNGEDLAKTTALSSLFGLASGAVGGSVSGQIGGGFGAFVGGASSNLTQQGLDCITYGSDYKFNIASPFISGAMSAGLYHINLAYHYKAGHIKESTGWNYRQFARNMAYTQRSISKNREVETITKGKGISYAEFGTENSTRPTDCEPYKGASSAYHTHQSFGSDDFSVMQNKDDHMADEWARKLLDFDCGKSNMPMYLGTREGHIHFMNGGGIDGSINFNFLRIFVPNNYWLYYDYYTP